MQRKWRRKWRRKWQREGSRQLLVPFAAVLMLYSIAGTAGANPSGGIVTSGAAAITAQGPAMTVAQTTDKVSIDWQSFAIAKGETVRFVQPGSHAVALNRVTGNNASAIYGTLNANGRVYLINQHGVLFAPGAQVSVGGLVVSTLDIADRDFQKSNDSFSGTGTGSVVNQGNITAAHEAVLLGPVVKNEGIITAAAAGLGAGNKVRLDFNGDKLLSLTVDVGAAGGSAANSGRITADGGLVVMSAGTKDALLDTVVNNSGILRAQSIRKENGVIRLEADTTQNSGTLDAVGKASGETGGTVKVLGDTVTLVQGTRIDVSGDAGGGTALVGGNFHGQGTEQRAAHTAVAAGAVISADAVTSGSGGQAAVWSDGRTTFAGTITAQGGASSGNGGSVETSGHTVEIGAAARIDTRAAKGSTGSWLLDPVTLTVDGSNIGTYTGLLSTTNATMTTSGGDLSITVPVSWQTANTLALDSAGAIAISAPITAYNGGLTVQAAGTITDTAPLTVHTFRLQNGTWQQNASSLPAFSADDFQIAGGTFLRVRGGDGSTHPYQIGDAYGLQGIGSMGLLGKSYALADDIDASGTATWNSGAGFVPLGDYLNKFTGNFDGQNHVITGLTIHRLARNYVGLFGVASGGNIQNVGLTAANVTGPNHVGILAGENYDAVSNSYSTGSVTGSDNVGGLVGWNVGGIVSNSYSTGSVSGDSDVGGLVGWNNGIVSNSYSTGRVSGDSNVGGLVGWNVSPVSNSYSTGSVSGTSYVGGLVGQNGDIVSNSYSTGNVSGNSFVGGLVGNAYGGGAVSDSYWDMDTSIQSTSAGGTGRHTHDMQTYQTFHDATWNISDIGGTNKVWRIYDGHSYPLLQSFLTPVTVSADSVSKSYDGGSNPAPANIRYTTTAGTTSTFSGILGGLTYGSDTSAGTHSLSGYYSTDQQGYDISYAPQSVLTITPATVPTNPTGPTTPVTPVTPVEKRSLTITPVAQEKTYGQSDPVLGAAVTGGQGLASGDSLSDVTGKVTRTAGENVGSYDILLGSGAKADSYNISYPQGNKAFAIKPATLLVRVGDVTWRWTGKAYSGGSVTYSGFVNGDTGAVLTGSLVYSGSAQGAARAGSYSIDAGGLSAGNYNIVYVPGTLHIVWSPDGAYLGAVGSKRHPSWSLARSSHFTGVRAALPLTIVSPGINHTGYIPWTAVVPAGKKEQEKAVESEASAKADADAVPD